MMHAHQWQLFGIADGFCLRHSDKQCSNKPRAVGDTDRIHIIQRHPRIRKCLSNHLIDFFNVMGNFKRLGVPCEPMDGRARLALLHSQMHPGNREPFRFSWKDIPQTGLGTKDYIAPDSFDFRHSRLFRVGQYWGAVSYLQILASELSDKLLAEILELDAEMTVTLHIQTVDQLKAIKTIKGKISDIGKMKVEEQRKAVRAGYDPDILPPDLITFSKDAAELLADLQSRNERMFLLTFTVVNMAPTRQRLENDVFSVGGIAQKYNCASSGWTGNRSRALCPRWLSATTKWRSSVV